MEQKILKAVLLLRQVGNRYDPKEVQIEQVRETYSTYLTETDLDAWIGSLQEELEKTPEQREKESQEMIERLCEADLEEFRRDMDRYEYEYCPSASAGDYSPSHPWDAPGMSVRDFI